MARTWLALCGLLGWASVGAAQTPGVTEGDFVMKSFRFASGETLPELRVHYRTLGRPRRDAQGIVRNAVLILHGTTGNGGSLLRPEFSGELFQPGGVLDSAQYYLVLPDAIGHGKSSKPSDGLRARFPRYGYRVTVQGQPVHVIHDETAHRVGVYMDRGLDSRLVVTIGERFDAALATGRYDSLFVR